MLKTDTLSHPPVDTRERLLDTAEALFAEHGFNATSLRAITQKAEANLAAVNYHFGSKKGLILAVIRRGLRPINEERIRLLEALMDDHPDRPGLEAILDCFYRPAFEYFQDPSRIPFLRLLGRTLFDRGDYTRELMEEEWMPLVHRYLEAFALALPELDRDELTWRFHFSVGAMIFTVSQYEHLEAMTCDSCMIREDYEPALARLIRFTLAGFLAPVSASLGKDNA